MTQQVKFLFCNNFAMTQQVKLELVDITREMDCQWFLNNPTHVLHFRRPTGGVLYFPADANAVCVIDADENWWMKLGVVTAPLSRVAEVIDGASYDDAEFIPLVKEFLRGCTLGPNGPELWPQIKRQAKVKRRQVN